MSEIPVLEIKDLSVAYVSRGKKLPVLRDVSFSINRGEAYGLVGESGCGKSTVAMAVMSYLASNAVVEDGSILLSGEDMVTATPGQLREWRGSRVSMVYQDPGSSLNPTMLVGRQVAEVYHYHGGLKWVDALAKSLEMFEHVRLSDPQRIMERYSHELSGGQQQRVMIAMALAANPALLVMDEPTTGLDATVEADIIDLVVQLRQELGTATLFISHNLGIVSQFCDRVGVLYAGRLVEEGVTSLVMSDPHHPYTIGLLKSLPRWGETKDQVRLQPILGDLPPLGSVLPGCPFATRCEIVTPECELAPPPLMECSATSIRSACLHRDELAARFANVVVETTPVKLRTSRETTPLIVATNVAKRFKGKKGEITVLTDVSMTINAGEILGLVGESGSGKTTLARTIAGLYPPDGGVITAGGASGQSQNAKSHYMQMVFQNPDTALNPKFSVARILGRAIKKLAKPMSSDERTRRVLELAKSVKLQGYHLELRPRSLSGGLKQRVAIGRAFAGDPKVVILDEPASALDVSVQATILNLLVDLQADSDLAYLFISHDLAVVNYLADRIVVMYLGEIVEIGPARSVVAPPHHPYTEVLFSANSAANSVKGERIRLRGQIPSLANPPSGCRFHTRCPRSLGELCATQAPGFQTTLDGHSYRCHIEPEELAQLQMTKPAIWDLAYD
jgi:peptide/nickel transport system ATP-binding protein